MTELKFSPLPFDIETINEIENVRYHAYGIENPPENSFYKIQLLERKYIAWGAYQNDQLIGGCSVSNSYQSRFIEQLFVLKNYQNSDLHIGTKLLQYVLEHKSWIEQHFNTKFNYSYLESRNPNSMLYQNLGYHSGDSYISKKRL